MDFVSDALANGRRIKVLTIVDDFSKEAIDLAVDFGISGHYVTRVRLVPVSDSRTSKYGLRRLRQPRSQ